MEEGCGGAMGNGCRDIEGHLLVHVAPNKPAEPGYQEQKHSNTRPAKPLIGTPSFVRLTPRLAGIFGKTDPTVLIGEGSSWFVGGEIASDPFFLVEPDHAGVFTHHAFIENPAREYVEVLLFQRLQVAVADLSDLGNGVQGDAAELALLP